VGVILVRVDDVLFEVGPEPGEVVNLRPVLFDPLCVLQVDGVVALVAVGLKHLQKCI